MTGSFRGPGDRCGYGGGKPLWVHFGGVTQVSVVPQETSTVIGSTTIDQMLTIEESAVSESMQVIQWVEVDSRDE